MADSPDGTDHLGSLFESITGQSTVTEPQHPGIADRFDDRGTEGRIAEYIDTTVATQGFDDVIEVPEEN